MIRAGEGVGRGGGGGGGGVQVQCCLTSTETIRTIRDVGPRTATSTLTQFFVFQSSSSSVLLDVHRDYTNYYGRGAQDGHLNSHTVLRVSVKFKFNVAWRPQRLYELLWTGSPGRPPQLSHSSWALKGEGVERALKYCYTKSRQVLENGVLLHRIADIYFTHICPEVLFNAKYPDAKGIPFLANGGLLHKTTGGNIQPSLLWIKIVPLQS